ncbi:hypothetical protein JIG36_01605 [Actinoplanes sp. LDG1-06]|uniref:Uncharacterized protein n=1 Tax=Paractinoplanes ovalisporus TaxID=2810368 RepID=A0ABS2A334_9ACTN|nr:hypothetical protein [Actinoplanes ovalisporus]MBM2614249.1 hypothetical protein [Actinoplanes ovalisporus]
MSVTVNPAPARTDDPTTRATATAVRRTGWLVAAGAAIWAGATALYSPQTTDPVGVVVTDLGALPFQIGLFALVTMQLRTAATGTSRVARGMLRVEYALLTLATLWTVLHAALPGSRDAVWMHVLDMFWPLSMLGMFVIGVKIALTGRWKGLARGWPLVAESWAVVCVPIMGIFGMGIGQIAAVTHLLIGYTTLGVILALRPHLTGARD